MALITLSCFLRKGYEDKLVLAGEESCRASRIGRRQACSLLQVLSITYVSHSPPWLLLTMYPFSSCKWPACILISNIPCTDCRAISPSNSLPSEADGFTVVRVKSWPRQCQQSQISSLVFHCRSASSSVQRLAVGWLLLSPSRAPLRKSNPLQKMQRCFQRQTKWCEGMVGDGKTSHTTIWLLLERVKY